MTEGFEKYKISLTITKSSTNEQVISIQAPELTGPDLKQLVDLAMTGIKELPPPVILTMPRKKPSQVRKPKKRNLQGSKDKAIPASPPGFSVVDVESS